MFDLLNNWDRELSESLTNHGWHILKEFDRDQNRFDFTLSLMINELEIFRFYIHFECKNKKGSCGVYIDTFDTWSLNEINEGSWVLDVIKQKCDEVNHWFITNDLIIRSGRL